ncbi:MAG: hypothetical protein ACLTQI_01590 [Slackia sp.]
MAEPLNIVLVEPKFHRTRAHRRTRMANARLHLVEPMGFRLTGGNIKRAGCDYWDKVEIVRWPCSSAFFDAHA